MICNYCGEENADGAKFCRSCGAELPASGGRGMQSETQYEEFYDEEPVRRSSVPPVPPEYKPISMWGYLGYEILFSIPLIGFILLLVFALGGSKNINVRNFARSYFCVLIIVLILTVIIFVVALIYGIDLESLVESVSDSLIRCIAF